MKIKLLWSIRILVGILILIGIFIAFQYALGIPQDAASPFYNAATASSATCSYLLKEYNGKIGVFRIGNAEPFRILETYVATLPVLDQSELKNGIYLHSEAELKSVIEDYTG